MWRGTLPEKAARGGLGGSLTLIAALFGASGCSSDHHVSPWGGQPVPSLEAFAPRPDLAARLASIDAETAALGLARSFEQKVTLPRQGGPAVIRGYDGHDPAGRAIHAVRVAAPLGVVMAVGPLDPGDLDRTAATELVPALVGTAESGAYRTGTDLNGDGRLDVVLRSETGALAVWHFDALGSGAYEIAMAAPPTRGVDIDEDGRIDLEGEIPIASADPIAPRLGDVATFADGRYANTTPAARAWHARKLAAIATPPATPADARLRAVLERAWHTVLAGREPVENVLRDLRRESVPTWLRASFDRHTRAIAAIR
jgi:hypothetical protein